MIDLNWWQSLVAFFVLVAVVGWCGSMHREAKRTADLLQEIVSDLRIRRAGL